MKVLEKLSTQLPLKVTANLIEDEGYWRRCCKARWDICDVTAYGGSWKRMYFEKNMQKIIENFVPESTSSNLLYETMPLSANYIKRLEIGQLLPPVKETPKGEGDDLSDAGSDSGDGPDIDHFDFAPVLQKLPYLQEFHVTYGVKDCGMNFEWNLFQFTARDCLMLAKCIASCKNLKVFRLHRSKVDDDKVRVLISHILDHPGLIELDLSHNQIGDRGARAIGKFLNNHSKLVKLNVSDNVIRPAGAQAIAHALTKNTTLQKLDIRLNRLADEGGQALCRALLKNTTLTEINMASNDLTEPTAAILSQVVVQNSTVNKFDLSGNRLGPVSIMGWILCSRAAFVKILHFVCLSVGMARYARYISIESILLKYCDEILEPPLRLSVYIMKGKVKILQTYPKSEEIISFIPNFHAFADFIQF